MRQVLFILLLFFPLSISAQSKLWFSNKVEVGYDKIFVAEQLTFENGVFAKNSAAIGLKFKVSDVIGYKVFYLLQNSKKDKWISDHFFGAALHLKLQ